jgi:hypothetical protein
MKGFSISETIGWKNLDEETEATLYLKRLF